MSEQEKQDEDSAPTPREGPMTEMEAAARLFALQDRLRAEKSDPPRLAPVRLKGSDLPALQEFAEKARAEGPKKPLRDQVIARIGRPSTP